VVGSGGGQYIKATRKRTGKIRSNLHTGQYAGSVSPDHNQGQTLVEPLGITLIGGPGGLEGRVSK